MFEDGTAIGEKVQTIALLGMGTGVSQVSVEIFVKQMNQAVEEVVEEKYEFPKSWWNAAQRHQLLYSDSFRDLQF